MKNVFKYIGVGLVGVVALSSCSDDFIDNIKNYDNVNVDIYNYESGVNGRLNDLYSWSLPDVNNTSLAWKSPSAGTNDDFGKASEEYSGFSTFLDPENELNTMSSTNSVVDMFMGDKSNIQASVYGRIRNINDFIENVEKGGCSEAVKQKALGQAHFFRAWCYYLLFNWYGGVPIVDEVQDPVEGFYTPRSSARAVKDFIISELDQSAQMLAPYTMNGGWESSSDWGRVTTGTALALKGRVLVLWASPLFNRAGDQSRYTSAYNTMKAELDSIKACGYDLYSTSSNVNASDFAAMFTQTAKNPEAVFVTLYNNVAGDGLDNQKNNSWERWIRPKNTTGSGFNASAREVDIFPMSDGKIPASAGTYTKLQTSSVDYDENVPFVNRDPRFYRTFAFPGFRWAYTGNASNSVSIYPSDGSSYVLWNYCWYSTASNNDPESTDNYFADGLLNNGKSGVYVRKKSDDLDVNKNSLYTLTDIIPANGLFAYSGAQHMEIRFAEVLLNLAEAACGAGQMGEAVELIKQVRTRAGYSGDCGLQENLVSDQAACMSAILYERQIEFAYEGKRYYDLRRWLLYDGGANFASIQGCPEDWKLTGWNGNTCSWLGFAQLNGTRRENMVFSINDNYGGVVVGGTTRESDPLYTAALNEMVEEQGVSASEITANNDYYTIINKKRGDIVDLRKADLASQTEKLASWYKGHLVRQNKKGDKYDSSHNPLYINFRPNYYFLGFTEGASIANPQLPQTIGWQNYNEGGAMGTFDPLAD